MPRFSLEYRAHPEAVELGKGWQVRHRLHHKDSDGKDLYIPERVGSELRAKASGPLLAFASLMLTWILSILFATRYSHVGLGGFNIFLALQFILWTIIRQGMAIVALMAFEIYYTSTSRKGQRRTLSLYALDAWMSLIITPINVFRGKFLHVVLILLPSLFSIFAEYAPSSLLGQRTSFELHANGVQRIQVGAAGGGAAHNYVMTGQEFLFNASQGCLATPNNRFVFLLEDNKVLIPSIPDIGTYSRGSSVRAARLNELPSLVATLSARVGSDRSIFPQTDESTTVPSLGNIALKFRPLDPSSSIVQVQLQMYSSGIHRQIYLDIHYRTVVADLLFATFRNGTQIYKAYEVRNVSVALPGRLNGSESLEMDSVLDNFIYSQNGATLLNVATNDDTRVQHLGLLLAAALGIRSARLQNWIDGAGEREAGLFEEREVVKIPRRYWAVAASISGLLAIVCIMVCFRRPTINGNLVQLVALLGSFIQESSGACTPNWQKAYAEDNAFEDRNMNHRVMLGYAANKEGGRKIFTNADGRGIDRQSYRIAFDASEKITKDRLSNLYGLLAG